MKQSPPQSADWLTTTANVIMFVLIPAVFVSLVIVIVWKLGYQTT